MSESSPKHDSPRDGRATRFEHRRGEILNAVVDHVLTDNSPGVSLRSVAEAVGVSHKTLLHHFQTKERLVTEVLATIRARAGTISPPAHDVAGAVRSAWNYWSAPERRLAFALYFETYAIALRNPDQHHDFLQQSVTDWLNPVLAAATAARIPHDHATRLATSVTAEFRGLLLDITATCDTTRVTAALDALIQRLETETRAYLAAPNQQS